MHLSFKYHFSSFNLLACFIFINYYSCIEIYIITIVNIRSNTLSNFIVLTVLLVSSFVIGQEDPDLSPFDATVTVGNEVPFVVLIPEAVNEQGSSATPGLVDPVTGTTVPTDITFIVEDNNGAADIVSTTVQYTGPAPDSVSRPAAPLDCGAPVACPGCTANQKQFTCGPILLNYFELWKW